MSWTIEIGNLIVSGGAALRKLLLFVCWAVVPAYAVWTVVLALSHGVFRCGALAEYSLTPWLLLGGFLCSLVGVFVTRSNQSRAMLLVTLFALQKTLLDIRPAAQVARGYHWAFDLAALASAVAVIGLGAAIYERYHPAIDA